MYKQHEDDDVIRNLIDKAIIILFDELLNYFCRHIFVFKASSRRFKFKAWHQDDSERFVFGKQMSRSFPLKER